jgi:cytochrome c biogenesis protein CcmG/thiol:disulfide interchange protein DsbE
MRPNPSRLSAALLLLALPAAASTLEEAGAQARSLKPALSSFGVCPLPQAMGLDPAAVPVADRPAPDFTVRDTADNTVRLSEMRGKVVLLDFWATWCGPCRAAVPHLQALHVKHVKAGLRVVGLNNREDVEAVRAFEERYKLTYTGGLDSDGAVASAYGVQGLPTLVLIDRGGKIVWRDSGFSAQKAAALDRAVESALGAR